MIRQLPLILQVVAISTSFVSLSYGFVSFRQEVEEELGNSDWTWKDMVIDMVWNILTISSKSCCTVSVCYVRIVLVLGTRWRSNCHCDNSLFCV